MVTLPQLTGLGLACALLIAVPGPSVLFVIGRALSHGRRTALASILGNSTGSYVAAACVAFGLGPLLATSTLLFSVIKFAGAAYLVWLGVHAIRHSGATSPTGAAAVAPPATWRAVRTGVVVGVTNPKAFIISRRSSPSSSTAAPVTSPGRCWSWPWCRSRWAWSPIRCGGSLPGKHAYGCRAGLGAPVTSPASAACR